MADDELSLDDILSAPEGQQETQSAKTEEAAPAPEVETTTEAPQQPRGPDGKFAPKEAGAPEADTDAAAQAAVESQQHEKPAGMVPHQALHEARQENAELRRRLDEMAGKVDLLSQQRQQQPEKKAEPPKARPQVWENPDDWGNSIIEERLAPLQQSTAEMRLAVSQEIANIRFGEEVVTAAQNALKEAVQRGEIDPARLRADLERSALPIVDIVKWHQNSPAVREAKLEADMRAKILAEYGIDPNAAKSVAPKPSSPEAPRIEIPPSLSRLPSGSVREGDETLDQILAG